MIFPAKQIRYLHRNLVTLPERTSSTWNFFHGKPALTTSVYPDDLDTTSLAFRNVKGITKETKHAVMDKMLKYVDADGLFNVNTYAFLLFCTNYSRDRPPNLLLSQMMCIWVACCLGKNHVKLTSLAFRLRTRSTLTTTALVWISTSPPTSCVSSTPTAARTS